jgi:hypothetical protein
MNAKDINAMIQKYTSPQALKDFDSFLDNLPLNVGNNALIAAGVVCLMGAASMWFCAEQLQNVSKLRTELTNVQALQPPVPVLKYVPVKVDVLKPVAAKIEATFKGVKLDATDGDVKISAADTDYFPQFLAAISYLQRGGRNWKVKTESMCVGRECKAAKLSADMKVEMVEFVASETKASETKTPEETEKPK